MTKRTFTLTFNGLTLDTTNLRMDKVGGKEVIDYFFLNDKFTIEDDEITDVASFRCAIEEDEAHGDIVIENIDGDKTTVKVTIDLYADPPKPDPQKLECMSSHMDGAHCGLGDWYKEIEEGIQDALNKGPDFEWTTGWYASKKEIASACITHEGGNIKIEVSVSDDFDTPGLGTRIIPHTTDIDRIREVIYEAWEESESDQKSNRLYVAYSVMTEVESYAIYIAGKPQGKPVKHQGWVETYVKPTGDALMWDYPEPPGDNYHTWGFQDEYEIPEDVKEKLAEWASDNDLGEFTYGDFTIKAWDKD